MNLQRVLLTACLLLAMVLGGLTTATAQVVPAGPRIPISDDTASLFGRPAVAFDPAGNWGVVWGFIDDSVELFQEARIFGRFYGPDDAPFTPPLAVDGGAEEFQFDPDVAALAEGRFLVVWSRWETTDPQPHFRSYDVFGHLVDTSGEAQGPRFLINDRTPFWQITPAIAAGPDGTAFVVWPWNDVGDQGPWPQNVGARRVAADGTLAPRELQVNRRASSPVLSQHDPTVAVATDRDGESLVVWATELGNVFARRYDAEGRPRGPEVRVDVEDGYLSSRPAVAAGVGGFLVLWESREDHSQPTRIVARAFRGGGPSGPIHAVGAAQFRGGVAPAVTSDAEGRFVATWTALGPRSSLARVAVVQLTADGGTQGAIRVIGLGGASAVAAGPDGDVLVVWRGSTPNGLGRRVYGRRFQAR